MKSELQAKLDLYVKEYHDNQSEWFIEETETVANQQRVLDVENMKEYLNGNHAITQRPNEMYNGKEFVPRKIILQYAKTLLNFQTAYLLQNPITLTGNEKVVKEYQNVNKKGKYDRINTKILDKVNKYGLCAEYVYLDKGVIKSKLIDPSTSFPIYDHENTLIAFIEGYINQAVSYYTVFTDEVVYKYDNNGGELRLAGQYPNLSGLPIVYHNQNELSDTEGRSDLLDYISILDSMEDLLSKYTDGFYKFMNPIPVAIGQQLKGDGLPVQVVGGGITLDDGSDFKLVSNGLDYKSFETIYKTLLQSLLDVSQTPAVSMNKTDISNLSEVSIKLLFSLANIKAGMNEQFMRDGIEQRFEKIRKLMEYRGVSFSDMEFESLDVVFQYAMPSNDKEIIENLKVLRELSGISLESLLEHSPFTKDVQMEMKRLDGEGNVKDKKKLATRKKKEQDDKAVS
ncbi:phage portal protein [Fictibacillus phosphorivorans]|uniref:phage portal protein n=1 Tax=Fictibacillus phosphorivorans TaxID=1221500 RepID=UPI00203E61C4|nr:phage portal protein [Fictibacillus phosphorivorans]MCM3719177.1 phage portal protein [Fictibacillus phosphorivorans]MCM3776799.1 phage portal protein [Fictibacillus phosphorivorans]